MRMKILKKVLKFCNNCFAAIDFEINPASVDMYFRSVGVGSLFTSKLARHFKTHMVQQKNITNI
jgi:hypothetical protein